MKKRILAVLFCIVMLVCSMPLVASAATYIATDYGIQIETPHPGRTPQYDPFLADYRFSSVSVQWYRRAGGSSVLMSSTDKFVDGNEYRVTATFKYDTSKYSCDSNTVCYINGAQAYNPTVQNGTLTVSATYTCSTGVITGVKSPSIEVTAPVAGAAQDTTVKKKTEYYDWKYDVSSKVEWYNVDLNDAELDANGNLASDADAFKITVQKMGNDEKYRAGHYYAVVAAATPSTGYTFDDNTYFLINDAKGRGLHSKSGIFVYRIFYCTGEVESEGIGVTVPAAGKFADPEITTDVGSTFGQNVIVSSYNVAEKANQGDSGALLLKGDYWKNGESNIKIFECGKSYMYGIWASYKNIDDITFKSNASLGINGSSADTCSVVGKSFIAYQLFQNVQCNTSKKFTDMRPKEHWAHNALDFAYANGYLTGTSDTTMSPAMSLTRAMVVQVLYAYEGKPSAVGSNKFTDVPSNAWYTNAVCWAANNGIVSGGGDGTFNPNGQLTREQFAIILKNFAKYKGIDVSNTTELSTFSDGGSVSSWAADALKWTVAEGFISGSNGMVMPQGSCTREQFATILRSFVLAKDCPNTAIIANVRQ